MDEVVHPRWQEGLANARLIAAAPEMLQMLKRDSNNTACVCRLNPLVGGPVPCQTCQRNTLIIKAGGEE